MLFFCPIFFNFLKRLAGGFRNEFPHDEHVGDTHHCKEQECSGRSDVGKEPRSELSDEVGSNPERQSCDAHCHCTHLDGIHLAENNPNNGANRACAADDVEHEEHEQEHR